MTQLQFTLTGNPENAPAMTRYMKNKFKFLGVKSVERKTQSKVLLQTSIKLDRQTLHAWIADLYQREAREYQYVAIDLATKNVRKWEFEDVIIFKNYIAQKSWWDSVDAWRTMFGKYIQRHPDEKQRVFELFFQSPNFWERRVAIDLQLMEKNNLDPEMLTQAILADQDTDEFFIQKAIGWALRQYSKTNPEWVSNFLATHKLRALAVREASKYL
ncbi:DNA alkylation repair protein [Pediococcus siamensis]|uniref:DNA alkylation repair protein n=1 Tax=Pediococcus siamensis TaxID=381829 RepID=UPI0039A12C7F